MCQWLLARGSDFKRVNYWGHGVVSKASWHGHNHVLEWLFTEAGCRDQLWIVNHVGEIAVELAEQAGHDETVALMLTHMKVDPMPFRSYGGGATVHHHKELKINAAAGGSNAQSTRIDDM